MGRNLDRGRLRALARLQRPPLRGGRVERERADVRPGEHLRNQSPFDALRRCATRIGATGSPAELRRVCGAAALGTRGGTSERTAGALDGAARAGRLGAAAAPAGPRAARRSCRGDGPRRADARRGDVRGFGRRGQGVRLDARGGGDGGVRSGAREGCGAAPLLVLAHPPRARRPFVGRRRRPLCAADANRGAPPERGERARRGARHAPGDARRHPRLHARAPHPARALQPPRRLDGGVFSRPLRQRTHLWLRSRTPAPHHTHRRTRRTRVHVRAGSQQRREPARAAHGGEAARAHRRAHIQRRRLRRRLHAHPRPLTRAYPPTHRQGGGRRHPPLEPVLRRK
mmetsp:Transcript_18614/g.60679  ORF Transcript_18614/g.60679 Transcript_18614/m.60679 type:complete len:343 (+) Transcript_18614:4513-5541(+)